MNLHSEVKKKALEKLEELYPDGNTYMNTGNAALVPTRVVTGQHRTTSTMCSVTASLASSALGCLCIIPVSGMGIAEIGSG